MLLSPALDHSFRSLYPLTVAASNIPVLSEHITAACVDQSYAS